MHQLHIAVSFRQGEVGNCLLIETNIPTDFNALLGLRLFQPLVIVCLQLYQWTKNILVLITIFISEMSMLSLIRRAEYSTVHFVNYY